MTNPDRKTSVELSELEEKIKQLLAFSNEPLTITALADKLSIPLTRGARGGFAQFVKNRFFVEGKTVHLEALNSTEATQLCKKMARALDRMAQEIEALKKENAKLRAANGPQLSERARKALAVYGD